MLFDTDVLIWALRGNKKAADVIDRDDHRCCSVVSYMELLQGIRDKKELREVRSYLAELGFVQLPLTEDIGQRASIYLEEYALKSGMGMADALIAATAEENEISLCTGNMKHYRVINDLSLRQFRP